MKNKIKSRSAGIVIHNDQILLMFRIKKMKRYYCFPGGTVESNESSAKCAEREISEEASIKVKISKLFAKIETTTTGSLLIEYFYEAKYISGTPQLQANSVELKRQSKDNFYKPLWFDINKIQSIDLFPIKIKEKLIQNQK